jgi:hypothetical protein
MTVKQFNQLLQNLPDEIKFYGNEAHGTFRFSEDKEIKSGIFDITFTVDGYQDMDEVTGEEEQGISNGWELNQDNEIEVNYFTNLLVYDNDLEVDLSEQHKARLTKNIIKLITLNY